MADVLQNVIIVEAENEPGSQGNEVIDLPQWDAAQLEKLKEEYFQSGYSQGKIDGIAEGTVLEQEKTINEKHQLKHQLKSLIEKIPEKIAEQRLILNQEIATIVLAIIQQLFVQRQTDKSWVFDQINQILHQINQNQEVELFLHPSDIQRLHEEKIQLNTQHIKHLKICPDPHLLLGGCRLKTNHGLFDVSIDKQIQQLKELLMNIQKRENHV